MLERLGEAMADLSQQQDNTQHHKNYFAQEAVIEGGKQGDSIENRAAESSEAGKRFRKQWLLFLQGISHAFQMKNPLLDFMAEGRFCPLCPFGPTNAFPPTASKHQVGLSNQMTAAIMSR